MEFYRKESKKSKISADDIWKLQKNAEDEKAIKEHLEELERKDRQKRQKDKENKAAFEKALRDKAEAKEIMDSIIIEDIKKIAKEGFFTKCDNGDRFFGYQFHRYLSGLDVYNKNLIKEISNELVFLGFKTEINFDDKFIKIIMINPDKENEESSDVIIKDGFPLYIIPIALCIPILIGIASIWL